MKGNKRREREREAKGLSLPPVTRLSDNNSPTQLKPYYGGLHGSTSAHEPSAAHVVTCYRPRQHESRGNWNPCGHSTGLSPPARPPNKSNPRRAKPLRCAAPWRGLSLPRRSSAARPARPPPSPSPARRPVLRPSSRPRHAAAASGGPGSPSGRSSPGTGRARRSRRLPPRPHRREARLMPRHPRGAASSRR
jgi:hypothetical protein